MAKMTKKTTNIVGIAALLGIVMIFVFALNRANTESSFHVVKHNDCYTYQSNFGWVDDDCYGTYAEAEADMRHFIAFKAKQKAHDNRDWKPVTE